VVWWCARLVVLLSFCLLRTRAAELVEDLPGLIGIPAAATATSRSGQFIVHGQPAPLAKYGRIAPGFDLTPIVQLQPAALAVTAERIQAATLARLGAAPAAGRGHFHLFLIPTNQTAGGPVTIVPRPFREGWQFRVGIPTAIDWRQLVRGLSEVVLLEMANRNGGDTLARTPLWLNEGLAGILASEDGRSLVQESEAAVMRAGRRGDPAVDARTALNAAGPITYAELTQPTAASLGEANQFARYQASAVFFTHQLLGEPEGRARLRQAVLLSPQFLNWELAFLRAFDGRFINALDVEKWWAVTAAETLARDPLRRWTRAQTLQRLRSLTVESADSFTTTNAPAARRQLSLGEVLISLDFSIHREVIQRKLGQLRELYTQAPDDLLPLVRDYHRSLSQYLETRQRSGSDPTGRGEVAIRTQLLARQTARRMDWLDRSLAALN